ncbi:MAG TPA: hypothetical protein VGG21_01455 [Acidimicrobiales bacterium]|jgi:hypothetical protein
MAPREVVLGLDPLERGISLFGASIALILALVTGIEWDRNTPTTESYKWVKKTGCKAPYTRHATLCEHVVHTSRSAWEVKFFFIVLVGLCILYFALRRKRAGVMCFAIFLGLGVGVGAGLVFFFLGAWLMIRAYRLQRYGVPTMMGSNQAAREMAKAKREGRAPNLEQFHDGSAGESSSTKKSSTSGSTRPGASKRYTPKKPPPKRR